MTERDKQNIAKIDMFKARDIVNRIYKLNEKIEELGTSLYGTGIDYSKDHVQTSPNNAIEERMAVIYEFEKDKERQLKELEIYKQYIKQLPNDMHRYVLMSVYIRRLTLTQIAIECGFKGKGNVQHYLRKALVSYYTTICCGRIKK